MEAQLERFRHLTEALILHGPQLISGVVILFIGLYLTKWLMKYLRANLSKWITNAATTSIIVNTVGVFLFTIVIAATVIEMGADPARVFALLMFICTASIGIVVVFRPLLPKLPFKVGDTVKAGNLLGKVERTTILNTQLRTFDGKTFFVPNRTILDDIVINYHYTKTRRIKINVVIGYDQDLLKAKQVLETVMIEDPRVLPKPNPQIYVLNLTPSGVEVGARCWVDNKKFWMTKCDLTEKIKYKFDQKGIAFAHTQLDIYHHRAEGPLENDMADEAIHHIQSQSPE